MKNFRFCVAILTIAQLFPSSAIGGNHEVVAGKYNGKSMGVDEALATVCEQTNKLLPRSVDKITRLDNTTHGPGRIFTYNYTITSKIANIDYFLAMEKLKLKGDDCKNKALEVFFKNNITISYSYKYSNGAYIGRIDITPRDCADREAVLDREK